MTMQPGTTDRSAFTTDFTYGRSTQARFDITEQIATSSPWVVVRKGSEIAGFDSANIGHDSEMCQGVRYWPSGVWTLVPWQERYSDVQATYNTDAFRFTIVNNNPTLTLNIQGAAATVEAGLGAVEIALFNKTLNQGVDFTSNTLTQNDFIIERQVVAGQAWGPCLNFDPSDQPPFSSAPRYCITWIDSL